MYERLTEFKWLILLAGVLAGNFVVSAASGQSSPAQAKVEQNQVPLPAVPPPSTASSPGHSVSPYVSRAGQSGRARMTYQAFWGIDRMQVMVTSSGALLRFSYRIVDAAKAKALQDERSTPYLIDEKTGAVLQVPNLPKVGELRPKMTPIDGKEYWMVFSNKGFVKPGSRVDIVIGEFRAKGLVVESEK